MSSFRCNCSRVVLAATVLFVAACGARDDARTEKILPGIARDSAMAVLHSPLDGGPPAPAPDSLTNIWNTVQYFMKGKLIEIIWYSAENEHRTASDTVPSRAVVPIVVIDGKVVGVGRAAYKEAAEEYALPRNRY